MSHFNRDSTDYHFTDTFEAGLVLTGSDAKSLRLNTCSFKGSKVDLIAGRPFVLGLSIPKYKYSQDTQDTTDTRPLLLTKKELAKLISLRHQKYMAIPIKIFKKGKWFKLEFGVGKKLKKFEKRQQIKDRDLKRQGI